MIVSLYRAYRERMSAKRFVACCEEACRLKGHRPQNAWRERPGTCLWAHAGSGRLHVYGNSQEAFDDALAHGFKVLEADVELTSDGVPVMTHRFRPNNEIAFDGVPSYEEFMRTPVNGKFTPLSFEMFLDRYAKADAYLAIDPSPSVRERLGADFIRDYMVKRLAPECWQKVIYQVSGRDGLREAVDCPFGAVHYNLDDAIFDPKRIWMADCLVPALKAVGIGSVSYVDQPITSRVRAVVEQFAAAGIWVSVASVNSVARFEKLRKIGVRCIDTDFVYPADLKEIAR